jgi:hypothetical protein
MDSFADSLLVKDALQIYFSRYHFADGGYHLKWFRIKLGPVFIPLPNIKSRVDAVKIHDIHHLLTNYNADYRGEAEIGAWELASGCEKFTIAWLLNLGSFLIGMLFYPKPLWKAFIRGRKCATNLYHQTVYNDELLNRSLGELRKKIQIDAPGKTGAKDYLMFAMWCLAALAYHVLVIMIVILIVWQLILLLR